MPSVESGLEGPGIEPKPEETDSIDTDKGFTRALREKPGGDTLPASANEMGAANSPHRKKWVQDKLDESQKRVDEAIRTKDELSGYMAAPSDGDWRSGITVPDDAPKAEAPAPSAEATATIEHLQRELTAARGSLSEMEQWEAAQSARDELEEAENEQDVHAVLSELREKLPAEQWAVFQMESLGDQLITAEEFQLHNQLWDSEQAYGAAEAQAQSAQKDADALAAAQHQALESELERLGITDQEAQAAHLLDMAEFAAQMNLDPTGLPIEEYREQIEQFSAFVAEGRRAYRHKAIQESIVNATSSGSVEDGLTLPGGIPVNPPLEIEPEIDWKRFAGHKNIGKRVDIAAEIEKEVKKSSALGDEADAVYRQAVRASEAQRERARRGGF